MTTAAKLAKRAKARITDYRRTFSSEQGKRVLYDLVANHFVMGSTYVRGDAIDMAFREGQRQVILKMLATMKVDPEKILQLIKESDTYATTMD